MKRKQIIHIHTPHLAHPEQAVDFQMEVSVSAQDVLSAKGLTDDGLVLISDELFLEFDREEEIDE